jgi:hypothetical protein
MSHIFKIISFFIIATFVVGCATPQQHKVFVSEYNSPMFSNVSVRVNDGYVRSDSGTTTGGIYYSYTDKAAKFFVDELRRSDLFETVEVNNAYIPLSINVNFQRNIVGSEVWHYSKAMLHFATLMMFPIPLYYEYTAGIDVTYLGKKVNTYNYQRFSTQVDMVYLFRDVQASKQNAVISIVSEFTSDLAKVELPSNDGLSKNSQSEI